MTSLNTRGITAADLSQEMVVCFLSSIELAMVVEYKIPSVGVIKEVLVVVRVAGTVVVERVVTVAGGVVVTVAGGVAVTVTGGVAVTLTGGVAVTVAGVVIVEVARRIAVETVLEFKV